MKRTASVYSVRGHCSERVYLAGQNASRTEGAHLPPPKDT